MASLAVVGVMIGVIVASIGFATYMYSEFQPNFILANSGEPLQVGPVKYMVTHVGEHEGDENTAPQGKFFQIQITAENLSQEATIMSGGQFHLLDATDKKYQATFGNFSKTDLLLSKLEPNKPVTLMTQFDIPFDDEETYRIGILPTKIQSSRDIGIVCVKNC